MANIHRSFWLAAAAAGTLAWSASAFAQSATDDGPSDRDGDRLEEIIVTAQKRSESQNRVGMSINAVSSEALLTQGVTSPADLVRLVPGFQATEAPRGTPVYSIRGIGFDDSTLGSNSTVALYVDEVPLTFAPEARFATLDLERVEVLKGPQGILFGQNSTGGAINFVAAKPTQEATGGIDATYGRFDQVEVRGFVSTGLTDTLKVRLSGMAVNSGPWQKSYTRDDELGAKRQFAGRFLAEWDPTEDLTLTVNVNGWVDKSDTLAAQLIEVFPQHPSVVHVPYDSYPRAPANSRAADWDANPPHALRRDDNFFQASVRADYALTTELRLTSLTSWSRFNQEFGQDADGTAIQNFSLFNKGYARSFSQELRLAGDYDGVKFVVGGNYDRHRAYDTTFYDYEFSSTRFALLGVKDFFSRAEQPIRTYALFGNVDYSLTDQLTLHGGLRYTKDDRSYIGCSQDPDTDGLLRTVFNLFLGLNGTPLEIQPGGCINSLNGIPGEARFQLKEDNVSWRVGLDYQVTPSTLLYANVSRGYKSGSFPSVNSASSIQNMGVKQESVLAYEAGFKASVADRRVQINGAGFYYDYTDKQLRGRILDPFGTFGVLEALLNIPKSRIYGAEVSIDAVPADGLRLNASATYVNSKVTRDLFAYDPTGRLFNYKGLPFPHTPKWSVVAGANYERPVTDGLELFAGASLTHQSATSGLFNRPDLIGQTVASPNTRPGQLIDADAFRVKPFTTVDAQLGFAADDGSWRAWLWGKNVFDTYYISNATQSVDALYRLAAMPATYGITLSLRFQGK